ncbi:hypothetical protein CTheo_6258 [Ceratobasidium theobromae]|uniref:pectin lyase n=1 Tax=Ceratobasidium theobromae TaxID=1582974 RepID=A0A5N5QFR7_9AGAM|nr:hypothetical protein CTheo_6258 [Ceratobasidium theobromae]
MYVLGSLAAIIFAAKGALAVGSPMGYATGTTGGAGAAQAIPSSAAELKSWLEDSTTRNILLDRTYDFTDTEGSLTGPGCKPWTCSPNPQLAINANNWCSSSYEQVTVTYKSAGTSGIRVKSNKTILGKGTSGWIKGKGLMISGQTNVIIQNIRISDINPQFVWGGDAIYIDNSSKVWIDHNYIQSVGRQFIVTGFGACTGITISNNYFNGESTSLLDIPIRRERRPDHVGPELHLPHSVSTKDLPRLISQPIATSVVSISSGRGPHIGGTSGYKQTLHMFNNYFNDITGHALDPAVGSQVLAEGNYFNAVKTPSTGDTNGVVFAPTSSTMNAQCSGTLSRNCVSNTLAGGSGSLPNAANTAALSAFTASVVKSASIMDPASVPSYVLANAGLGKVN